MTESDGIQNSELVSLSASLSFKVRTPKTSLLSSFLLLAHLVPVCVIHGFFQFVPLVFLFSDPDFLVVAVLAQ